MFSTFLSPSGVVTILFLCYSVRCVVISKVGKTTRSFRYDLNKIPCDYTVEVTTRFKALDLMSRVPEELWMGVCNTVQEAVTETTPK